MFKTASDPGLVRFSLMIYRILLGFYPRNFRWEYGPHMAQVFRDCSLKTCYESGIRGLLTLWALTLVDWVKTVIEEQLNRGTEMTRTKFIRLSGWGMVLAGLCLLLTFLPEADSLLDRLYRTFGQPGSADQHDLFLQLSSGVRSLPFPVALFLVTVGLIGMYLRFRGAAGKTARTALWMGVSFGAAALVTSICIVIGVDIGRPVMNIFVALMFVGLLLFGITALRNKPMPRGNGLPVLAGMWWPLLTIQAYVVPQVIQVDFVPVWFSFAIFSMMGLFLALLGYVLQADAPLSGIPAEL